MDKYLLVVNRENEFNQEMLKDLNLLKVKDSDGKTTIEEETYNAFLLLSKHLQKEFGIVLTMTSAGRTVETQQSVLNEALSRCKTEKEKQDVRNLVAQPGQSEHHTRLAIDYAMHKDCGFSSKSLMKLSLFTKVLDRIKPISKTERVEYHNKIHECLAQFGFILRYPEGKEAETGYNHEEWHIRYVGVEHAKAMAETGMCLEEYVALLKEKGQVIEA